MKDTELDCGDNSCYFAKTKGGMRTNGGCRCFDAAGFSKSLTSAAREMLPELLSLRAEVERLTEQNAILRKQEALKDADRAQLSAEVDRLKAQLAEHADHPHLYICPQVAKSAADMGKERDALKAANTALATENARLVNEHAAAMSRAEVLAEGVRLLAACANIRAPEYEAYQEWRSKHGHMVSK